MNIMHESRPFKLSLICGGPSQERGISLNSARSIMDHLQSPSIEIIPFYVDFQKRFFRISQGQLYSNTPADFDFKLNQSGSELDLDSFTKLLKSTDLVFPVIHGSFGEDGELQELLEKLDIPFVGPSSQCCKEMFPKNQASKILCRNGFSVFPQIVISSCGKNKLDQIENFFQEHSLKRAIVKPAMGGSSIGVFSVNTAQEAHEKVNEIFVKGLGTQVVIEPFCQGKEFTVVVFENSFGEPVAFIPTEIEISYDKNEIFDYRKKYLPTHQVVYHTPPRWSESMTESIREQAEQIFKLFGMREFVRLDGWVADQDKIYFTDINPISGLEQNSFFFRQASLIGMSHRESLEYILKRVCQRSKIENFNLEKQKIDNSKKMPVYVLFGNHNAERQVSLMTGTNVWLKLQQSQSYSPTLFLLDHQECIWEIPYSCALNHTVEEVYASCINIPETNESLRKLIQPIQKKLGIELPFEKQPRKLSYRDFLEEAKREQAFVFIGLHGGKGENGTLQKDLELLSIPFNGSSSISSELCMDKYLTGQMIHSLNNSDIQTLIKKSVNLTEYKHYSSKDFENFWRSLCCEMSSEKLIVKPRSDGCSAGIIMLESFVDLERYCYFTYEKKEWIPAFSFAGQDAPVAMPSLLNGEYILEPYIETDTIKIVGDKLFHICKKGWIELTVGVLERGGHYHAFNPSITVSEGALLSLEEKFQGGTGINLTPPPTHILSAEATQKIKILVERAAKSLKIENYARLDIFFNHLTEKMILIEANTLPALTPSTVIYHQALAEKPSLSPVELLEKIITEKLA